MNISILSFNTNKTTENGALSVIEGNKDIPFTIRRIYYIFGEKEGMHRGSHAHKSLQQVLFCPHGKIKIMLDDGREKKEILLDQPSKGLLLKSGIWREMIWLQDDSILFALASEYYDVNDYIRDYSDFMRFVEEPESEH